GFTLRLNNMLVKNDFNDLDPQKEPLEEELEEIKEYHFHVYFFQDNKKSAEAAVALREKILELTKKGFFHPVPYEIVNYEPRGSYEVWCPKEHFSRVYSWFLLHRGDLNVLVHPLTKEQAKDHSDRAVWMGASCPLDINKLIPVLRKTPRQYPDLGLGYSAPTDN
ncbi:23560_t:CDS:2, partial [Gigaspora rosea]